MKVSGFFSIFAIGLNVVLFSILGCSPSDQQQTHLEDKSAVIYGSDDRQDLSEVTDPALRTLAISTVAFIEKGLMTYDKAFNLYRFKKPDVALPLCPSERFRDQSTWAHCSGSLIAPDLVLTAGHCMTDMKDCNSNHIVFDYGLHKNESVFRQITATQVYNCTEILYTTEAKNAADFAIIKLDRKVTDRLPLELSDKEVTYQDTLMMIGHPKGYPTKLTLNGKVRSLDHATYLQVVIDAYTGNSGSSVFDQNTYKIVGVLSRGEKDYVGQNSCLVSKVCAEDDCRGEDVTRVEEVKKFLSTYKN